MQRLEIQDKTVAILYPSGAVETIETAKLDEDWLRSQLLNHGSALLSDNTFHVWQCDADTMQTLQQNEIWDYAETEDEQPVQVSDDAMNLHEIATGRYLTFPVRNLFDSKISLNPVVKNPGGLGDANIMRAIRDSKRPETKALLREFVRQHPEATVEDVYRERSNLEADLIGVYTKRR